MARKKQPKPQKVEINVNQAQMQYLTYLFFTGLYGNDLQEVHDQVFCAGLRAVLPPDLVQKITWPKYQL